jgi:hypothetical protein
MTTTFIKHRRSERTAPEAPAPRLNPGHDLNGKRNAGEPATDPNQLPSVPWQGQRVVGRSPITGGPIYSGPHSNTAGPGVRR